MDGFRWRKAGQAEGSLRTPFRPVPVPPSIGFRLETGSGKIKNINELPDKSLEIEWGSDGAPIIITCRENSVEYQFASNDMCIRMVYENSVSEGTVIEFTSKVIKYTHSGFTYELKLECGSYDPESNYFYPQDNRIKLCARIS